MTLQLTLCLTCVKQRHHALRQAGGHGLVREEGKQRQKGVVGEVRGREEKILPLRKGEQFQAVVTLVSQVLKQRGKRDGTRVAYVVDGQTERV